MSDVKDALDDFEIKRQELLAIMNDLQAKGKMYMLNAEEIQLLQQFKQFKASIKKPKVFKWQTEPYKIGEG